MKIDDERKRQRLAKRVLAGELPLSRLRALAGGNGEEADAEPRPRRRARTAAGAAVAAREADDALMSVRGRLAEAIDELVVVLRQQDALNEIPAINRDNLAKYLTITKLKLENAITIIRASRPNETI
jgi:hypothetical protein